MMDINRMNDLITSCRMLDNEVSGECNTTQPVLHERVLKAVKDYYRFFGPPDKWMVWRSKRAREKREQQINTQYK